MQKAIKKYGVAIMFYIILIGGILLLNMRLKHINYQYNNNSEVVALNK